MSFIYTVLIIVGTLILYLYIYVKRRYKYFERIGVPYIKPFFIFGNMMDLHLKNKLINEVIYKIHKTFEGHRFGGIFDFFTPIFYIGDPELYYNITTKDSKYFEHRNDQSFQLKLPIPSKKNTSLLLGDQWRPFRRILIRAFTPKFINSVTPTIKKNCEKLVQSFEKLSAEEDFIPDDIIKRFMINVTLSTILGLSESSLENPTSKIPILLYNMLTSRRNGFFGEIKTQLFQFLKGLMKNSTKDDRITKLTSQIMAYRKPNQSTNSNFNEYFLELEKSNFEVFNGDEVTKKRYFSEAVTTLLLVGILPTTGKINACLAELAANHKVQNKLRAEINEIWNEDEELTLETIKKMKYLDMIICETLRRRRSILGRTCTLDYKIPGTNVIIPKGCRVVTSSYATHHDERFYEKPNEFYPEHFSEEARNKRPKWAYTPFGSGPRICIAVSLATLELKLAVIYIIKHFEFDISPKMQKPVDLNRSYHILEKNQFSIRMTCRKI